MLYKWLIAYLPRYLGNDVGNLGMKYFSSCVLMVINASILFGYQCTDSMRCDVR